MGKPVRVLGSRDPVHTFRTDRLGKSKFGWHMLIVPGSLFDRCRSIQGVMRYVKPMIPPGVGRCMVLPIVHDTAALTRSS